MERISDEVAAILRAPFALNEIEWRPCQGGLGVTNERPWLKILPYIDARAVMDRMDKAFGVGGWSTSVRPIDLKKGDGKTASGIVCTITLGPGQFHEDVAELTDIEDLKGGASGALKRAAVHLGIGRYLYDLGEIYAEIYDRGSRSHPGSAQKGIRKFRWDPPGLAWFKKNAPWALPVEAEKVINQNVVPVHERDDDDDDAPLDVKVEIKWPEGISAESRHALETANVKTLKAWYAKKGLGVDAEPLDPKWTREEIINAYLELARKVRK